jgi:hypothetical protein
MQRFQLEALFEEPRFSGGYDSIEDEMNSVRDGNKALASTEYLKGKVTTDQQFQREVALAVESGLEVITLARESSSRSIHIYFCRRHESWRAYAHNSLARLLQYYDDSDALEELQSELLGYTPEETKMWLKENHAAYASWNGVTMYCILPTTYLPQLSDLGFRCLSREALLPKRTFFYHPDGLVVSADAWRRVVDGDCVVRFSLCRTDVAKICSDFDSYGTPDTVAFGTIDISQVRDINRVLKSKVEVLTENGWSSAL